MKQSMHRRFSSARLLQHPASVTSLAMATLIACDDPLVAPQTVRGLRLLAAQVSALQEPSRASLIPQEAAQLRWLVVSDRLETFSASWVLCAAQPTTLGVPRCRGGVLLTQQVDGDTRSELELELSLPSELDAGDEWVAFLGVCSDEAPEFDPDSSAFSCNHERPLVGFYRGRLVSADAVEAADRTVNHNPDLQGQRLELDGEEWPVSDNPPQPGAPCGETPLQRVQLGTHTDIKLSLLTDDREPLDADGYGGNQRESLVFSEVATQDGLERAFLAIDHDSDRTSIENVFKAPRDLELDAGGSRVAFYITVLDERGGLSWLAREFCLEP